MRQFNSNEIATDFGMYEPSPGERGAYDPIVGKALVGDIKIFTEITADLYLDDATLQIIFYDQEDQVRTWEWKPKHTSRFERELMAALIVTIAHRPNGLELHDLVCLGWEWIK